ncbi:MAG: hypothetical protein QOJ16_4827 [Acidobacteriota bacterium]|jgi:hypothetical protein|nr:hypothetical protein [Acidobacteriota bacterium]
MGGPPPRDVIVLLAVVFVTFSLQFFVPGVVNLLRLTSAVWRAGFVWQLVTYPFAGYGEPSLWFLLELLILFLFARDVYTQLGRRHFWRMIVWGAVAAGIVALLVQAAASRSEVLGFIPFPLLQGQRTLMAIIVAAFATMNRRATIYLFFVLPIQARWFLGLEILFAFMGFLQTRDLAGFLGICTAVGVTYLYLTKSGMRRDLLRDSRLRLQRWWIQRKMDRMRKKSGLRVVQDEGGVRKGPWSDRIH